METNLDRIIRDLKTLETFNATPGNGITRSPYSKEDRQAKEYLTEEMEKLGLYVYEDGYSTLFGRKEGTIKDGPVIMIGSHYDSVVHGGAFDGPVGIVAALEVMRVFKENNIINDYPIEVICMNAEEGANFGSCSGVSNSRAMLGTMTYEELNTKKNRFNQTKREAMKEYGFTPDLKKAVRKQGSIKNFIEVHIEQGPVLDSQGLDIGLVEYVPGIGRYDIRFIGESADSTMLSAYKKDALLAASEFIVRFNEKIKELEPMLTGIVGKLDVLPNTGTLVSDEVNARVEIRTFDKDIHNKINCLQFIKDILAHIDISTEIKEIIRINYPNPTPPSIMNKDNVKLMEDICDQLGYSHTIINNGTGHDAMMMTDFCDTNMIYVPSYKGYTHCPKEWTDYEDIKKGADVLLHLVLKLCKNK